MRTKVSRRLTIDRIKATRTKRVLARTVCVWLDEQVLESRQQNLLKILVVKSIRRSLASVVRHWTNVLWFSKTERRRNDWRIKVLGSILRGWKAKPFEAWSSRSLQARCAQQMANRALKIINRRHTRAALSAGLHQWLGVVVAQKRARRQDNKREKLCTRWATRKCLAAWLIYRNKEARYRYIIRRIECRNACWSNFLCRESISSLRANADMLKSERAKDQQRRRLVTSKTLSRGHRLLQGYFMSWSVDSTQVLRMACKIQLALCKCRRRSLGVYMVAWHVHMRTKVSRRLTINRIEATRTKRVLVRTFCVWMEAGDRKRVLFRNIMKLLRNILCRCRMFFFRTWRGHSQLLKGGRLTSTAAYYGICDMMHHCSSTLLHQCLARWMEITGMNATDGSAMTVGYGVEVTTERSFEDLMVSEGEIRSFNEALLTGVCRSLEISRSCATVLCHQRGSVVATVILFAHDPGTSSTLSGEQVRVRAFLVVFMQRWVHASPERKRKVVLHTRIYTFMCVCLGLCFLCVQGEQAGAKFQRPRSARALAKQLSACVRVFGNTCIFSAEGLGWSSAKVVGPVTRQVVDAVVTSMCEQRQLLNLDCKGKVLSVSLSRSNKLVHTIAARRNTWTKVTYWHAWQDGIFARTVKHVTQERRSKIRSHRVLNVVWRCMRAEAFCVRALRKKAECIKWRLRAHSQSMVLEEMYHSMLERRRLRARARQVVAKSACQSLLHAICRWKQSWAQSRAVLQNSLQTKRRGMHRLLARTLSAWTRRVESATSALRQKSRQQMHMSKLEQLCVAMVLHAWLQMRQATRRHATSIQRLAFRQLRHRLSTVVVVWQQQARATVLKAKLALRANLLAVACCCRKWSAHTAHARSSQSTVCAARKRNALRWSRQALCAWKDSAHWGVHTLSMTSRIFSRANCVSVRATVETWRRYTKRRKMLASKSSTLRVRLNVRRMHAELATWRRHATHVVCARRLFDLRCGRGKRMKRRFCQRLAEHTFAAWQLWTASKARMRRKLVALTRRRELTRSLVSMRISLDTWKQAAATVVYPSLPPLPFSWWCPCLTVSRSLFALHVSCSSTPADLLPCTWARNPPSAHFFHSFLLPPRRFSSPAKSSTQPR
jgi:hypothetical protein